MVEPKAKPAAKKVVAAKTSSKVAAKPKSTKTTLAATVKKAPVKKAVVAANQKTEVTAVKKGSTPAEKVKITAKKNLDASIKPAVTKSKPVATMKQTQLIGITPTPEERYRMVETAAYYIAERHGFQGRSDEHWAAAEREVATKLGQ